MARYTDFTYTLDDYEYTGQRYYDSTDIIYGDNTRLTRIIYAPLDVVGNGVKIRVYAQTNINTDWFTITTGTPFSGIGPTTNVSITYDGRTTITGSYQRYDDDFLYLLLEAVCNQGLICVADYKSSTSYGEIPDSVEIHYNNLSNTAPVTRLNRTFYNCKKMTSAPEIKSGIIDVTQCFQNCQKLAGNIIVNNTPTSYTDIFLNTVEDIYIVNGGNAGTVWKTIAGGYNNVHYQAEDNPAPVISDLTVSRVGSSGSSTYNERGTFAHIQATINVYDTLIPVGWTNNLKTIYIEMDGTEVHPTWSPSVTPSTFPANIECWIDTTDLGTHSFTIQIADSVKNNGTEIQTLSSQELTIHLLKTYTLVDYYHDPSTNKEGIAFGKYAEHAERFEVDMLSYFTDNSGSMTLLFDLFYPIGSYYETSVHPDNFNPNVIWGGTWILETEGQVHVSASNPITTNPSYPISGALTNTSDGGNVDVAYHTHVVSVDNHSITQPRFTGPSHTHGSSYSGAYFHTSTDSVGADTYNGDATGSGYKIPRSAGSWNRSTTTGSAGTGECSRIEEVKLSGHNVTVNPAGNINNTNYPPYINVYRWHRIA